MKKKLFVLLIFAFILLVAFTGCAGESEPLRICVDLEYTGYSITAEQDVFDLINPLQTSGQLENVAVEIIPASGTERDTALDRIRTEIMSGGGPDVFIVRCIFNDGRVAAEDALFPVPEKIMEAGLFLPLDTYMEQNTQYAEWDRMTQSVMAAGRNGEGQQLIPVTYTLPSAVYLADDVEYTPSASRTWADVLADEALYAHTAGVADGKVAFCFRSPGVDGIGVDHHIEYVLGDLSDYAEDNLLFTEEELLQHVNEILDMQAYTEAEGIYTQEKWFEGYLGSRFNISRSYSYNGISQDDRLTLVPISSDDGGYTATITAFAAVNRNTKRPEDAFLVVDRLLSESVMRNSPLYEITLLGGGDQMVMHEDILRAGHEMRNESYCLSEENFAALSAVRDAITNVEFGGTLQTTLEEMMLSCEMADSDMVRREKIVHETYENMKRMMSE